MVVLYIFVFYEVIILQRDCFFIQNGCQNRLFYIAIGPMLGFLRTY